MRVVKPKKIPNTRKTKQERQREKEIRRLTGFSRIGRNNI